MEHECCITDLILIADGKSYPPEDKAITVSKEEARNILSNIAPETYSRIFEKLIEEDRLYDGLENFIDFKYGNSLRDLREDKYDHHAYFSLMGEDELTLCILHEEKIDEDNSDSCSFTDTLSYRELHKFFFGEDTYYIINFLD